MKLRLPSLMSAGFAAVLLGGALLALPGHAGAQTPANGSLVPVTGSSPGSGLVTLSGYNSVAVTLNGGAFGGAYNVFSCTATMSAPALPTCQLDGAIYSSGGGQATGSLVSPIPAASTAEVFVQNAGNANELYAAVFNGTLVGTTSCATGVPIAYFNGFSNCTLLGSSASGGVACNYFNLYTSQPVCLPIGGGYFPLGSFFSVTTTNTACIPGGGYQPVLVGGVVVWQFC